MNRAQKLVVLMSGAADTTAPTVAITLDDYTLFGGGTATVTFTFSEAPVGFTVADVTAPNGSLSAFGATGNPLIYTATFTADYVTDATNVITVGTSWTDAAGNPPAGATTSDNYTVTALALPYTFATPASGAWTTPWTASTWSGKANTPTLGTELLTDPGLEANYTAGLCDSLEKAGSPTVAQSADAHGGTKAQSFTAAAGANRLGQYIWPPVLNTWYQASVWAKVTAGVSAATNFALSGPDILPGAASFSTITEAEYTQHKVAGVAAAVTETVYTYPVFEAGSADFPTVIVDDMSLKAITPASLFALLSYETQADVVAKVRTPGEYASWTDATMIGVVIRADANSNPGNYILGYVRRRQNGAALGLAGIITKIGNTYASVLDDTIVTFAENADIELRASGTTVSLWYNGAQVSTDKTINNAALNNNKYHGIFSAGGNIVNRFFLSTN